MQNPRPPNPVGPGRVLGMVMGVVFAGIGLTVIGGLWTDSAFGGPPLFFKMFGSFIALAFVAFGWTFFFSALGGNVKGGALHGTKGSAAASGEGGYKCPACGAGLGAGADVSPKGDVKCGYCKQWFNIHG